jgi:imidazolonepropionase-like amidohydrolase
LSREELAAIYDEAHKLGLRVATHLFSQKALRTALEAGIGEWDTIEHIGEGSQPRYPDDIVNMIVEQQVAMAPTIIAEEGLRQIYLNPELVHDPEWGALMPSDIYEDIRGSYGNVQRHPLFSRAVLHRETKMQKLRQLYEAGANFIVASDSGSRANPHHNAAAREMSGSNQWRQSWRPRAGRPSSCKNRTNSGRLPKANWPISLSSTEIPSSTPEIFVA